MNRKLLFALGMSLVLSVSTAADRAWGGETYDERLIVPFDGRHWVAAHADADTERVLTEYVLPGEVPEKWSELVTIIRIPLKPANGILNWCLNFYQKNATRSCDKVRFNRLDSASNYLLFSFDQALCYKAEKREYSLGCFHAGVDGVHLAIYAARSEKVFEKNYPIWRELLKSATTFRPSPDTGGPGLPRLADPQKMIQITYRLIDGDGRTGDWKAPIRKIWRSGTSFFRAEEEYDPSQNLKLTMITHEPDAWMINEATKQGQHMIDPGPTYFVLCPAFGEMKEDGLKKLEYGGEVDFFTYYGAREIDDEFVNSTLCDVFELPRIYWVLRLYLKQGTTIPVLLTRRGPDGDIQSVCYDQYLYDLPFDSDRFSPPKDVVIMEAQ